MYYRYKATLANRIESFEHILNPSLFFSFPCTPWLSDSSYDAYSKLDTHISEPVLISPFLLPSFRETERCRIYFYMHPILAQYHIRPIVRPVVIGQFKLYLPSIF